MDRARQEGRVRPAARLAVARASVQAVEATGPVKPLIEPDMSQAAPTATGGAGTRRRSTRVNGFAVGIAPGALGIGGHRVPHPEPAPAGQPS